MNIDIKHFLRKNGFTHRRDIDRGSIWGNGIVDVTVLKVWPEPGKMRAMMDAVREAARKKNLQKQQEEKAFEKKVLDVNIAAAINRVVTAPPAPTTPTVNAVQLPSILRKKKPKLKGPERLYALGRIKWLSSQSLKPSLIVDALKREGVRKITGEFYNTKNISTQIYNWKTNPKGAAKIKPVSVARGGDQPIAKQILPIVDKTETVESTPPPLIFPMSYPEPRTEVAPPPRLSNNPSPCPSPRKVFSHLKPHSAHRLMAILLNDGDVTNDKKVELMKAWLAE